MYTMEFNPFKYINKSIKLSTGSSMTSLLKRTSIQQSCFIIEVYSTFGQIGSIPQIAVIRSYYDFSGQS